MRPAIAAALVLLVFGCGTIEGPRTGTVSPPTDALALWNDFPADQVPRPIVLFNGVFSMQAYSTRNVKLAALCGKFALGIQPPAEVPNQAVAGWPDGNNATYQAISAGDAYAAMVRNPYRPSDPGCASVAPIVLSGASLSSAGFATDRGTARMSAWLFTTAGARDAFGYPALAPSAYWHGGVTQQSLTSGASTSSGGRVLTFNFVGGPPDGPCGVDYIGVVAESSHAVAVAVESSPGRVEGGPVACTGIDTSIRSVTLQLASALGGRVVVDASGGVVPVSPAPTL